MARNHIELFLQMTESHFVSLYGKVKCKTMLSVEALYDLYLSVKYVEQMKIKGAICEVGVWQGGSLALALLSDCTNTRHVIGFDTFEGHPMPNQDETDLRGNSMRVRFMEFQEKMNKRWGFSDLDECRNFLIEIANGDESRINLVKGDIKDSYTSIADSPLSILRIDCDWYEPSLFALEKLYPRLQPGGILIMDDFGHHSGQKKAFFEYFKHPIKYTHVDYSCITLQKPI